MSIEKVRTSFEKFKEAFEPGLGGPSLQKMPQELLGLNPGWIEEVLNMLLGDLNQDRVAKVKQKLRDGLDCQKFICQDGVDSRGCLFSGSGRGDCEHFIGLPGKSIPGRHDGPDDTLDEYDRPNGWCEVCWRGRQIQFLEYALFESAKAYGGQAYAELAVKAAKSKAKKGLLTNDDLEQLSPRSGAGPTRQEPEYTAYIIEANRLTTDNGRPVYLRCRGNPAVWTPDIDKAFQFCRSLDAERYMGNNDGTWKISEHVFCDIQKAPNGMD